MPLTKVCVLHNFDVYILDLIYIFLDKDYQQSQAHQRAARHYACTAKAHHKAQCAHAMAENYYKWHAQADPMNSDIHNDVAEHHRAQASTHELDAATYSEEHGTAALNRPLHRSLRIASDSSLHA
jgi:hypothetical protein